MKTEPTLEKKIDLTDVFIYALSRIKRNPSILNAHQISYLLKSWFKANGFDEIGDKYKFDASISGIPYDVDFDKQLDSENFSGLICLVTGKLPYQNAVGLTKLGSLYGDRIRGELIKQLGKRNTRMLNNYIKCVNAIS